MSYRSEFRESAERYLNRAPLGYEFYVWCGWSPMSEQLTVELTREYDGRVFRTVLTADDFETSAHKLETFVAEIIVDEDRDEIAAGRRPIVLGSD